MPTLTTTKTYADGDILFESDLDQIRTDIETFLNVTKIDDDNIQNSGITASTKLIDGTITVAKMASDSVSTTKIVDAAVTTAKINDAAVTLAKHANLTALSVIGNATNGSATPTAIAAASDAEVLRRNGTTIGFGQIGTDSLSNSAVTTAKIADGAITQVKRAALGQQVSASSGAVSTTSESYSNITNLSVTITTTGRPVFVAMVSAGDGNDSYVSAYADNSVVAGPLIYLRLIRDSASNIVAEYRCGGTVGGATGLGTRDTGCIFGVDVPAAGTYTYYAQYHADEEAFSGNGTAYVNHMKLVAFEL